MNTTKEKIEARIKELEALVSTPITNGMMYALELARLKAELQAKPCCTTCGNEASAWATLHGKKEKYFFTCGADRCNKAMLDATASGNSTTGISMYSYKEKGVT